MELIKEEWTTVIDKPSKKFDLTSPFETLALSCRRTNSPGGCLELFAKTRSLLNRLQGLPNECQPSTMKMMGIKNAIEDSLKMLVIIAWSHADKTSEQFGWLQSTDIQLFCQLQDFMIRTEGTPAWETLREDLLTTLPNPSKLTREQIWRRSLLAVDCRHIL